MSFPSGRVSDVRGRLGLADPEYSRLNDTSGHDYRRYGDVGYGIYGVYAWGATCMRVLLQAAPVPTHVRESQ